MYRQTHNNTVSKTMPVDAEVITLSNALIMDSVSSQLRSALQQECVRQGITHALTTPAYLDCYRTLFALVYPPASCQTAVSTRAVQMDILVSPTCSSVLHRSPARPVKSSALITNVQPTLSTVSRSPAAPRRSFPVVVQA